MTSQRENRLRHGDVIVGGTSLNHDQCLYQVSIRLKEVKVEKKWLEKKSDKKLKKLVSSTFHKRVHNFSRP